MDKHTRKEICEELDHIVRLQNRAEMARKIGLTEIENGAIEDIARRMNEIRRLRSR